MFQNSLARYLHFIDWHEFPLKKVVQIFFLGFSAGLPILLIFSTLSLWLSEAGVSKSQVTYFSWAALGYSFKFIWAPIVDKIPLPVLSRLLGRRRGWLLLAQLAVVASIIWIASVDPVEGLKAVAFGAVALGFSSATQDIVIDTYRIECAKPEQQAILSSSYISGYRIGMVVAGAGGLYLADWFGSTADSYSFLAWQKAYWIMALVMGVGILTTLLIPEPRVQTDQKIYPYRTGEYLRFFGLFLLSVLTLIGVFVFFPTIDHNQHLGSTTLGTFLLDFVKLATAVTAAIGVGFIGASIKLVDKEMVVESYIRPVSDFFLRYSKLAIWILLLIGFYRVSDIVMGIIANVFYQDIGFTKSEIASVTKVFGLLMTITGSFIGGFFALKFGVIRVLMMGAILSSTTNLAFMWLSSIQPSLEALTVVIAVDNLSAGIAVSAFVAWLSSLTSVSFTATQYAIFSSVMTLFPKLIGGYSGTIIDGIGYSNFFLFTALLGLPIIFLIMFLQKKLKAE